MKNILFATSEAVPFIKTGGLADVAGSLPKYFDKRYFDIRVILPKYACTKQPNTTSSAASTFFRILVAYKTNTSWYFKKKVLNVSSSGFFSYMLQIYEINPLYIWHKRIKKLFTPDKFRIFISFPIR